MARTFFDHIKIEYGRCPPGCSLCREACAREKEGDARGLGVVKPVDVPELDFGGVAACVQCSRPRCARVCPTGAIAKSDQDGVVRIQREKCTGCGLCHLSCPYGGISYNSTTHKSFKCDTCNGQPACVSACPHGVLSFLKSREVTNYFKTKDLFAPGTTLCSGCGAELAARFMMRLVGKDAILFGAPGCAGAITEGMQLKASTALPAVFCLMTNVAPTMTGVKRYYQKLGREVHTIAFVGDGTTADVGFQTLSGAAERGENIIYVCYDNEAYMATGIQRSGTTPYRGWTFTSPVGRRRWGKEQLPKNVPLLMAFHSGVAYAATATVGHLEDFAAKFSRALEVKDGMSYIHLLSPCPTGWRAETDSAIDISRIAVETNYFPLWECVRGKFRLTWEPKDPKPVRRFTELTNRFSHLKEDDLRELQEAVNSRFALIKKLAESL